MNFFQKSLILAGVTGITGLFSPVPAQAFELSFTFQGLDTSSLVDADLRLTSGGHENFADAVYNDPFDIDEAGEYFELFVYDQSLGNYGCYAADNIVNLNGVLDSNGGCYFDLEISSVASLFNNKGLDFLSLIQDGIFSIKTVFTEQAAPYEYSILASLTTYHVASPPPVNQTPTDVPTPLAVLPVVSGLFLAGRRAKQIQ